MRERDAAAGDARSERGGEMIDKDEIKKIILAALESDSINYTVEIHNTGDGILNIEPIQFRHEIPPPPLDPAAKKYIILRGNESEETRNRLEAEYGNVTFLPSCAEIEPLAGMQCKITVNGRVIAYCDERNVLMG